MILVIDAANDGWRIGAVQETPKPKGGGAFWVRGEATRSAVDTLAAARRNKKLAGKPSCIVVAQTAKGGARDVTWSLIRSAVAAANSLGFALGVPVAEVGLRGGETDDALAAAARAAAAGAKTGVWAGPEYDGEPTITKAKT